MLFRSGRADFSVRTTVQGPPNAVRLGDISGDGRADIVGATGLSRQQPDGTFAPWTTYPFDSGNSLQSAAIADMKAM